MYAVVVAHIRQRGSSRSPAATRHFFFFLLLFFFFFASIYSFSAEAAGMREAVVYNFPEQILVPNE